MAGKRPNTGVIIFVVGTALIVGAIGYRAFHPVQFSDVEIAQAEVPLTLVELQAFAEKNPGDEAAWKKLGDTHFEGGGYAEAARAYTHAAKLDPGNAALWSVLGESRKMASVTDPMPPEALAAFQKAIALDPADPRARYFIGMHKQLSDDPQGALADWLALLRDTPRGAMWEGNLLRSIAYVSKSSGIDVAPQIVTINAAREQTAKETE